MNTALRKDAEEIARGAIDAACPDAAVRRALEQVALRGNIYLVAVGKAAWQMADAAIRHLRKPVERGIVLTKYGHTAGPLANVTCMEAGHPVPDSKSYLGTQAVLDMTEHLTAQDTVLFLLSGGGSALFEKPLVSPERIEDMTRQLLASGPAAADSTTREQAIAIAEKYGVYDPEILELLSVETPKAVPNVHSQIIGSVRELCRAAGKIAQRLGYETVFLTDELSCEASHAGRTMAELLSAHQNSGRKLAFIAGGETVVHLHGSGLGGRNQELVLAAVETLASVPKGAIISVGSDGTDGPTDAAGGYADADTMGELVSAGMDYHHMLRNNDSYHALNVIDGLIFTGPTGTNVNDVTIGLLKP